MHFDVDGYPVLDLTEEKDLNKELADVEIKVLIKAYTRVVGILQYCNIDLI